MLHGVGAGNFFESFRKWFISNRKEMVDGRTWSEYLLFASDYPYFGDSHAEKLLIYIINKQFFDTGGTIEDTRNILGLNQIRILPEYSLPQINKDAKNLPSTIISNPFYQQNKTSSYEIAIQALAKLIIENKIDIKNFCLQFKDSWGRFGSDIFLSIEKSSTKEEIKLYLTELVKNQITLLGPMHRDVEWKKFGYKYFNPEDRAFFASFFKRSYFATDINKAIECLNQIL